MAKEPKPKSRLTYQWYVFVMKTGSVERCIGTRLHEDGELLEVYDQDVRTLAVQRNQIVDRWQQERRVTKAGEQRIREALQKKHSTRPTKIKASDLY
jgi:hypothetical protein